MSESFVRSVLRGDCFSQDMSEPCCRGIDFRRCKAQDTKCDKMDLRIISEESASGKGIGIWKWIFSTI